MRKYDIIFESLQAKVISEELTVEEAEILNEVAFEKYGDDDTEYEKVTESADEDESVTYEEYLDAMVDELFDEASKEEADELAKQGLKHRHVSNSWWIQHNDSIGKDVDVKQRRELEKSKKQMSGEMDMTPEDRKRNIRASMSSKKPYYANPTYQKHEINEQHKKAVKFVDDMYDGAKKNFITKKRQEKEREQIKKEYMADRTGQIKRIIKDNIKNR